MTKRKHPNKDIQAALNYAEQNNWRIKVGGSHAWGKIYCPYSDQRCRCGNFCITSINSTPKNPSSHAKKIRRVVDNCTMRNKADHCYEEE